MFLVGSYALELRGLPFRRCTWGSDIDLYGAQTEVEDLVQHLVQTEDARVGGSGNGRLLLSRRGVEFMSDGRLRRKQGLDVSVESEAVLETLAALPDNLKLTIFDRPMFVISPRTEAVMKEVCKPIPHPRREKHNQDLDYLIEKGCFGYEMRPEHDQFATAFKEALIGKVLVQPTNP